MKNIRHCISKSVFLTAFLSATSALGAIHEFETSHLKSMAGAGAGSVLAEESAFLNPAGLAFFNSAIIYAQKDTFKSTVNDQAEPKVDNSGFVLADGNSSLSGSLSHTQQKEEHFRRQRWGLSFSGPTSSKSAMGISVRKSKDQNILDQSTTRYYQTVIGVTHAIDEKTSLGIIAYDPFRSKGRETKAIIGLQHQIFSYITAMVDVAGNYYADRISKTIILKGALQIRALDDFYLRFGSFNDKMRAERGSGYGVAWIQPRLSFEFALKDFSRLEDSTRGITKASSKETSMAVSLRF